MTGHSSISMVPNNLGDAPCTHVISTAFPPQTPHLRVVCSNQRCKLFSPTSPSRPPANVARPVRKGTARNVGANTCELLKTGHNLPKPYMPWPHGDGTARLSRHPNAMQEAGLSAVACSSPLPRTIQPR